MHNTAAYLLLIAPLDPVPPGLCVTIAGVARGIDVNARTLVIEDVLTSEANTCRFELQCDSYSDKPAAGQEVIIEDGPERLFAGVIVSAQEIEMPDSLVYAVECQDYQYWLDRKLVVESYTNQRAGDIARDIITKYCPGFTTNNVKDGPIINFISFNYKYPSACLMELADITRMEWYVDYFKDLHFFAREQYEAPFSLTDEGDNYDNLVITPDISQFRNRVYFRGGTYLSDPYTQQIVADGTAREWLLAYKPHNLPIKVNGVDKTVGEENLVDDPSAYDFLMVYAEKLIKQAPGKTTLANGAVIEATYNYDVPVLTVQDDTESIAKIKALEGGDGIYEHIIIDPDVDSKESARQRTSADLKQYANPLISGSFNTTKPGLRSGQLIKINITRRSIDDWYLIRQVTITPLTPGKYHYHVQIETKLKGIQDLLRELYTKSRKIEVRDDEVLDRLLTMTDSFKTPTLEESIIYYLHKYNMCGTFSCGEEKI